MKSDANYFVVTYNTYLQLGVDGLRGLQNYNIDDGVSQKYLGGVRSGANSLLQQWGQAHSRVSDCRDGLASKGMRTRLI